MRIIPLVFHESGVEPRPRLYPDHGRDAASGVSDDNQTDEEPSEDEEEDGDDEDEEWSNEDDDEDDDNNEDDDGGGDEKPTVSGGDEKPTVSGKKRLAKTMSRGHPTRTTRRRTKLSILYISLFPFAHINLLSLFILSISLQTVSNMYSTEIFYIIAHRLVS